MESLDLEEKSFLLKNVMRVNVLTYAESFQSFEFSDFLQLITEGEQFAQKYLTPLNQPSDRKGVKLHENTIKTPAGFKSAWQKLQKQNWAKICAPSKYGGRGFPDSVGIAVQDAFSGANPALYYYLMQTVEAAKLIDQHGRSDQKEQFCQKLYNLEWSGCFSLGENRLDFDWNNLQTLARPKEDYYLISGTKPYITGAHNDLTENCVHILLARIPGLKKEKDQFGLFMVPFQRQEGDKLFTNNIYLTELHSTAGIRGTSSCTVTYGSEGDCRGYLIGNPDQKIPTLLNVLNSFRLQIALQGAALSTTASDYTINHLQQQTRVDRSKSARKIKSPFQNPSVANAIMYLKSFSEGIRGAVYMSAFYHDCLLQGAEQQNEFFSDLIHLYARLLKVYATDSALVAINKGMRVLGDAGYTADSLLEQFHRDLRAGTFVGSVNEAVAEEFLNEILLIHDGRMVTNLIKQFENVEVHLARTESLREAIYVWQEYIGGIIVMLDDLKSEKQTDDRHQKRLFAGKILRYFGDVVLCYHLIWQGLEAEKILEEAGLNFYNLKEEVIRKPEFRKWYNKLIEAEYFALNILSLHEATIRIMQRNPSSALDAVLEAD